MNDSENLTRTALVLGGGGSTGNAWLIGVIAGLFEAGLDVSDADLVVGTSAGATAAAQITGASPATLYDSILTAVPPQERGTGRPGVPPNPAGAVVDHLERSRLLIADSSDPDDMRRRFGAAAIARDPSGESTARWRAMVAPRLPSPDWPERDILITAVDAASGEPVVFDRNSGVDLVDAVAASTSSGAAYLIGEARYIDGGYRINAENADLASGYERVLVLSPFGGRTLTPPEWGMGLATQVEQLRAAGSQVQTISPGVDDEHLFGPNGMDLSLRPAAARAGFEQGRGLAETLSDFWR
jgi:NTE family protein